jgi:hypothetical protein
VADAGAEQQLYRRTLRPGSSVLSSGRWAYHTRKISERNYGGPVRDQALGGHEEIVRIASSRDGLVDLGILHLFLVNDALDVIIAERSYPTSGGSRNAWGKRTVITVPPWRVLAISRVPLAIFARSRIMAIPK